MKQELFLPPESAGPNGHLKIYLLGLLDFDTGLTLQRRLVYETRGDRSTAALILCHHYPLITVGRQGSYSHFRVDPEEFRNRQWPVKWVNRGGGCLLHSPGQLAIYPILPLDRLGLSVREYVTHLKEVIARLLADFSIRCDTHDSQSDVRVNNRPIATIGISIRNWVTYYGINLNVNPCLQMMRLIRTTEDEQPMTSLVRERRGPVNPAFVRQRLLEHFSQVFGFSQTVVFTDHPTLTQTKSAHAIATNT